MNIKKVFIIGSGFMGSGIAQVVAMKGYDVILNDISMDILERSRSGIEKMYGKMVNKGKITEEEKAAAMTHIHLYDDLSAASDCDLVIEAVVEKSEVKKSVFSKLSDIVREDTILATNTSSIAIAEIASAVKKPSRFIGMHFFSPVPLMKLLEIVKGVGTNPETVETVKAFGKSIDKVCIVAKDSPGFIVNRMLDPMINEAIFMVENGVASVEDIDNGAKNGLNHPMGPLELVDMIGIDVELAVMEVLYSETGDPKFRPSKLLRDMVRMNWLGRKTGKGFYEYHDDGKRVSNPNL